MNFLLIKAIGVGLCQVLPTIYLTKAFSQMQELLKLAFFQKFSIKNIAIQNSASTPAVHAAGCFD